MNKSNNLIHIYIYINISFLKNKNCFYNSKISKLSNLIYINL